MSDKILEYELGLLGLLVYNKLAAIPKRLAYPPPK